MIRRIVGYFSIIAVVAVLVGAAVFVWGYRSFHGAGPLDVDTTLILPRGAGLAAIADKLHADGVISDARVFVIGVSLAGRARQLKAGEYAFPKGVSSLAVMNMLVGGSTVQRRLTIPEGLTSAQVAALLADADGLEGAVPDFPEGSILPETYNFSYGDSRADLVRRMQRDRDRFLLDLWSRRPDGLPFRDAREALVLASIVEKETAVEGERPRIAAVFINRLRRGMRLQSDPTVAYGLSEDGMPLARPLTREDLRVASPYNTYLIDGLPPGPIANPGRAALAAVFAPAASKELYFVADGAGGHAFAETLVEHNRNVHKWRRSKQDRGD